MYEISIMYKNGFALPNSLTEVDYLVKHNSEISIKTFNSKWEAYCSCCQKISVDKLQETMYKQQFIQPILPTFEDVCKMPFHEPGFVENVPPTRFFAVVHRNYVGIYDNVKDVIDFLNAFQALRVKEFTDVNVAKWWINYKFMACIFPIYNISDTLYTIYGNKFNLSC